MQEAKKNHRTIQVALKVSETEKEIYSKFVSENCLNFSELVRQLLKKHINKELNK